MDDGCILQVKPSTKLREFLNSTLSRTKNIPETLRLLQHVKPNEETNLLLTIVDIKWVQNYVESQGTSYNGLHFFEMMEGTEIVLPTPPVEPRNIELEARCQKLRMEQANREYRSMTKFVDASLRRKPEDSISYQLKQINRQLIAVLQFVISVGAGFLFGFLGVELMIGGLDFGFRLLLGVFIALIIAIAEIYFLAKWLSEDTFSPSAVPAGLTDASKVANKKPHQE